MGLHYATQDPAWPDAPSLWCSTWAVFAIVCYMLLLGPTSVHLCIPLCRTSQYRTTFIRLSVPLGNDLGSLVYEGVGPASSRASPTPFYWPICSLHFCLLLFCLFLLSFYGLVLWGITSTLPTVHCHIFKIIIVNLSVFSMWQD